MEDDGEDGAFDVAAVKATIIKICKALLMGGVTNDVAVPFQHAKVGQWTTTIVENTLKELAIANGDAAKNGQQKYKYVVNAHLQQKVGAGLVTACATYGEKATDGIACVKWESEAIQIMVVVYGIAV
uniref:Dynein light chain n=1 Tax=Haptolina brevifila TaxID=156173 RepID=A0A7S2IXU3_9EUKA|mmetsp:Transcript_7333/g.14947  ORF Transcript_7333/g.14947 Transcript_7333/m.14947 type:complete len:127 (+) Transcript_7333:231-611(+)